MENKKEYKAVIAVHPGETLKEFLKNLDMTQTQLSERTGITQKHINEIINGKADISHSTSMKLEYALGMPASFWNNLQSNYDETIARIDAESSAEEELSIAKEIPYNEMQKYGFIDRAKDIYDKVDKLRSYFGVASLSFIPTTISGAFRKSDNTKTSAYALAAWIRRGEIEASNIEVETFNEKTLKSMIPEFRKLTNESPEYFIPKLKELCSSCGICLVLSPHLNKTYVQGVTKWINKDKVLLQLSFRQRYIDIFWFSFFHELGHIILKHGKKETYIQYDKPQKDNPIEIQADEFASNTLIPLKEFNEFINNNNFSENDILEFSNKIGILPGIVVGRLQHDGVISYKYHNKLKPKFDDKIA